MKGSCQLSAVSPRRSPRRSAGSLQLLIPVLNKGSFLLRALRASVVFPFGLPHSAFRVPRSAILLLFILHPSSFILSAEDADKIAHDAMRASPRGDWTLSAVLSTSTQSDDSDRSSKTKKRPPVITPGERVLAIRFQRLENGSREVRYQSKNAEGNMEGVRFIFEKDDRKGMRMVQLAGDDPIRDAQIQFLGSAFSLDDLSLRFLAWSSQELKGEETWRDRACWKLVSHPASSDASPYAKVESWVDKQYRAPLKAVAYDANGMIVKEFNVRSFQQIEGAWMLKHLDLNAPPLKTRSRLEILDAKTKD